MGKVNIPKFKSEEEEREYWLTYSTASAWDEANEIKEPIIDARPTKELISLRINPELREAVKVVAKKKGIGYQTLIQMWIKEKADQEITIMKK